MVNTQCFARSEPDLQPVVWLWGELLRFPCRRHPAKGERAAGASAVGAWATCLSFLAKATCLRGSRWPRTAKAQGPTPCQQGRLLGHPRPGLSLGQQRLTQSFGAPPPPLLSQAGPESRSEISPIGLWHSFCTPVPCGLCLGIGLPGDPHTRTH